MGMNSESTPPVAVVGVDRARRRWSVVLCALAAVLLALGTIAGIANRQLVDGSRFAAHVDQVRQDEAVSRQVGIAMTDAILRADADLTAVRPLIEAAAISVARSPTFSPVLQGAVRQVHDAFTQPGSGVVVLRLADIGSVLSGVVQKIAPQSPAGLPSNIDVTLARIGDQSAAQSTISIARRITLLAWLLPTLALGCFVGAAWLWGWRKNSLRHIGFAVVAAGALIVALAGGASAFAASADSNSLSGALRAAVLHVLAGLLWWPAAVLIGAGVVLRVLAVLDGDAPAGSGWRDWLAVRPASQRIQALRAAGLATVGAFVVLRPSLAVQTLAVVAGMGVLVLGLVEITRVLLQLAGSRRDAQEQLSARRYVWTTRAMAVLPVVVVMTLTLSLALPTSRALPAVAGPGDTTACNGFTQLCDRPYNDVAYPAAHNAMSAADEPGWYLAEQPTGLIGQLNAGIRVMLIDSWYGQTTTTAGQVTNAAQDKAAGRAKADADFGVGAVASALRLRSAISGKPTGPVEPYLCHGVCDIGATKWEPDMAKVRAWLAAHPREVVTFFIEDYVSPADTATVFRQAGLLPYVATHQVGQPWPTLGQMINTNKRLVVLMENHGGGTADPWLMQGFSQVQDTNYDSKTPDQLSCARNRGTDKSQLLLVNNWLNHFDAIISDAAQVNAYDSLYPRIVRCRRERGMIPNFVAVNYYSQGDLFKVVDALNGVQ
ncbi:hypothetical protein V3G39_06495 [Dermatophilaceae bacterium Sec6.4]